LLKPIVQLQAPYRASDDPVGPNFVESHLLEAQRITKAVVKETISQIGPGLCEQDIQSLLKRNFLAVGVDRYWHGTKVRLAQDTVKNFREANTDGLQTEVGDVCFLDVGPIYMGHEGDFGRTFVIPEGVAANAIGSTIDHNPLVKASEEIFHLTADEWKRTGKNGQELFLFASKRAEDMGYSLNPEMAGHRVGDFPHKLYSQEKLFHLPQRVAPIRWVLEIHLIHRSTQRGAFFEDILG
jgi:Xaa-Pro aminopeptidase